MLILNSTTMLLRLTCSVAGDLEVMTSYMDKSGSTPPYSFAAGPADLPVNITTATTTTIVAAPGAGVERNVRDILVHNNGAANAITIEQFDGTDFAIRWKGTLQTGERVVLDEVGQWTYYAADGTQKLASAPGGYVGTTVLTASGNFTTGATTRTIKVRVQAAGGGGAGAGTAVTSAAVGGGGSAGGYAEKTFAVQPLTAYAYTIGAAGTAGAAAGGNGNTAGNATFVVSAVTVTAFGGTGGVGMAGAATPLSVPGGASPAVSTNGDLNTTGNPGGSAERQSATVAESGVGGGSVLGAGGIARVVQAAGAAPVGFGGGGSGGCCINGGAAQAGGAGAPGVILVDEYT